jgi:small subunit ribosomal protein S1
MTKSLTNLAVPDASFDWEQFESGVAYSEQERKKIEAMYGETLSTLAEKQVMQGKVVSITKKEVVISLGYKSEAVVAATDFRYNPELAIGDLVEVYVESQEDMHGQLVVSHKKARVQQAWVKVNQALETGEIVTGYVKSRTKGGLIVDVFGIEAFLPGSQIDVKPIRDYENYVSKNIELKVVKVNHEFRNIVVSHKALIEAEMEQQKQQIIAGLEKGQVLEGVVKNMTHYGVFVDLGGVDGLIHITDLAWGRVNKPEDLLQVDQKLNVVILDFDNERKRISLGLKQLTPHPWDVLDVNLKAGDVIKGKVAQIYDYGAFVEIIPGVEGLLHVAEMSWSQHLRSAQEFVKVGDEIEAKVLTFDRAERKLALGTKQLTTDPWEGIEAKYPVGSHHQSVVKAFTHFGVYVELENGIDGIVHTSDLSWNKIKHPSDVCKVGDNLEVIVLELDKNSRRFHVGHKQIQANPWEGVAHIYTEGSTHKGKIVDIREKYAIVALTENIEGTCSLRFLNKADGKVAQKGEELDFVVIEVNKDEHRIALSHSRTYNQKEAEEEKKRQAQTKANEDQKNAGTFGEIDALSDLKAKFS